MRSGFRDRAEDCIGRQTAASRYTENAGRLVARAAALRHPASNLKWA